MIDDFSNRTSITGGAGIDVVRFGASRASFTLCKDAANNAWQIGGPGQYTVKGIERLHFSDVSVALDIDGSAGRVAKVLGAVFGKSSIQNAKYVGIGLGWLDGGMSYEKLAETAIDAALGANASHRQIVDLLYTNVIGTAPGETARAQYLAMLDSGAITKGGLGVLAADTSLNAANINLVGLADSGLTYTTG